MKNQPHRSLKPREPRTVKTAEDIFVTPKASTRVKTSLTLDDELYKKITVLSAVVGKKKGDILDQAMELVLDHYAQQGITIPNTENIK